MYTYTLKFIYTYYTYIYIYIYVFAICPGVSHPLHDFQDVKPQQELVGLSHHRASTPQGARNTGGTMWENPSFVDHIWNGRPWVKATSMLVCPRVKN